MEAKKNPSKDLGLQRNKFFLIGLTIGISSVLTAFEWQSVKEIPKPRDYNTVETEPVFIVPVTTIEQPKSTQLIHKQPVVKSNSITSIEITEIGDQIPIDESPSIDLGHSDPTAPFTTIDPPAEIDTIFFIAEKKPEPVNGYKSFYSQLSRNLKYPIQAKRTGTEGKVFVEFIVNRNGEPSDMKVIRAIGSGCEEEAMRVLALTQWKPGKQRGKPVRVKMTLPIFFMLSH